MNLAFGTAVTLLTLISAVCAAGTAGAQEPASPVATTPLFAFYSDFDSNLHDALLEAGRDRRFQRPELFQDGEEAGCFAKLPGSTRTAWDLAVAFYAREISSVRWDDREQILLRLDLSGVDTIEDDRARTFLDVARGFLTAAAPAYRACRWPTQDAANRRWVEQLVPLLAAHGEAVARRLAALYQRPLGGLPMRVDVMETVNWSGATTWILSPAGGHIQISRIEPGPASLELIFHEASHTLMGRDAPIRKALKKASERLDLSLPGDLWHAAQFHATGDAVSRVLAAAGEPGYEPMMFTNDIFGRYHQALKTAWGAYLEGTSTLDEAAEALLRAVAEAG